MARLSSARRAGFTGPGRATFVLQNFERRPNEACLAASYPYHFPFVCWDMGRRPSERKPKETPTLRESETPTGDGFGPRRRLKWAGTNIGPVQALESDWMFSPRGPFFPKVPRKSAGRSLIPTGVPPRSDCKKGIFRPGRFFVQEVNRLDVPWPAFFFFRRSFPPPRFFGWFPGPQKRTAKGSPGQRERQPAPPPKNSPTAARQEYEFCAATFCFSADLSRRCIVPTLFLPDNGDGLFSNPREDKTVRRARRAI